ncbi:MAG: hypothetical protein HZA17_10000 [Nitrospirae bacterium]|nr:hypothetical protein [Nitrospirota bacterium]
MEIFSSLVTNSGSSDRRKLVEIIFICVFCVGVLFLLTIYARLHIKYLPTPLIRVINEPHDAFNVWKDSGVRGRTLVLFDRHLGDEQNEYSTFDFMPEEFSDPGPLEGLCRSIKADDYGLSFPDSIPCIERLNSLLYKTDFYDIWKKKKNSITLSEKINMLVRISSMYRGMGFNDIPDLGKKLILQLNRLLIEATYPGLCPVSKDLFVTNDNYLFLAIEKGIIRRIFHLIPDFVWQEVESKLSADERVSASGGVFRFNTAEGVPVLVMRIKDLERIEEKVLINVNEDYWDYSQVTDLLLRGRLNTDLITFSGSLSEGYLKELLLKR